MGLSSETKIRVRYAETDKMSIAYHSHYLVWFEVGRAEFFRGLNLEFTRFEDEGLGMAVIEASCRYRQSARYDDEMTVVTEAEYMSSHAIRFRYRIYREGTVLLAEGKTVHAFLDRDGKMAKVSKYPILTHLRALVNQQAAETSENPQGSD